VTFSVGQVAVVMDASAIVELLSGDETWLDRWRAWTKGGAMILAPPHLGAEVANAMLRGIGLDAHAASNRIRQLFAMGLSSADRGLPAILGAIELADRHRLSVYDALYLELALDIDAELATLDRALAEASRRPDVLLLGPEDGRHEHPPQGSARSPAIVSAGARGVDPRAIPPI